MRARARWMIGTGLAVSAGLAALTGLAGAADPVSSGPDLGMVRPYDVRITNEGGRRLLRYTSQIANVGNGTLRISGSNRSSAGRLTTIVQNLPDGTTVPLAASMFYAGDGHDHWHLDGLETGELVRLDNGRKVGTLSKRGFCFYDTHPYRLSLPGAPQQQQFTTCGKDPAAVSVTMSLSIGWSDTYPWDIAYQYIDVTGLTSGRYRLTVGVNPAIGIRERRYDNNSTWADLHLTGNNVKVTATGPSV